MNRLKLTEVGIVELESNVLQGINGGYRLPEEGELGYVDPKKSFAELTPEEWKWLFMCW
ncbi:MAG: hypothetical protein LBV74_03935 [Tannerella sp.]|jgi:hypothetical protein|nr:hypothetical protein [Tannerella sp.]